MLTMKNCTDIRLSIALALIARGDFAEGIPSSVSIISECVIDGDVSPKPVAQKITTDDLHALISRTEYTRLEGTTKTFCHIFIGDSGFSVTGESACLNPADFDGAVGRDFAFKDAFNKLWPLEGYHRMRVADEKAKWLAGVEQDACSTFGSVKS